MHFDVNTNNFYNNIISSPNIDTQLILVVTALYIIFIYDQSLNYIIGVINRYKYCIVYINVDYNLPSFPNLLIILTTIILYKFNTIDLFTF